MYYSTMWLFKGLFFLFTILHLWLSYRQEERVDRYVEFARTWSEAGFKWLAGILLIGTFMQVGPHLAGKRKGKDICLPPETHHLMAIIGWLLLFTSPIPPFSLPAH